jgi:hypothetical protein
MSSMLMAIVTVDNEDGLESAHEMIAMLTAYIEGHGGWGQPTTKGTWVLSHIDDGTEEAVIEHIKHQTLVSTSNHCKTSL